MCQRNFNQKPTTAKERGEVKCTRAFYYSFIQIFLLIATLAVFFLAIFLFPQNVSAYGPYANPAPVNIGSAVDFTVIGKTGITSDSLTTYGGNIGVSPAAAAALTGVTCANMTAGRMYTITAPATPVGCITTAGTVTADNAKLSAATADFTAAYLDARNQATHPFDETAGAVNISANGVKGRGVYNYSGATSMATGLVLRGSDTDIWIFQINGAKTQAATAQMVLQNEAGVVDGANGPQAKNIFWAVDGAPSQGAGTHFVGVVMSTGAVSVGAGSTYLGRAFSDGTVSAATSVFSTPVETQAQATLVTVGQTISSPSFFGSPSFVPLSTTGGSGSGAVSFVVTTAGTAGCSIVGTTLSYSSGGTCTVTATKAGDTNYFEATSAPATFTVILGTEATAITNQGAGTYSFTVESGTLNAQYYKFRNLGASGLNFTGTPNITSLSYGDYELAVDGGTLISLASTTLNANASKVITGNKFATTNIITGKNVTLSGVTNNVWTFTSHTGNLDGENYDVDGAADCGSIRWNDSLCLLTQQTNYRWRNDDGGLEVPNTEWYDASWTARKSIRLENADAAVYTDAAVQVRVEYDVDMQADFSDLRFTAADGVTSIPYWIGSSTNSSAAEVWVKVPTLAAESTTNVFMYYKNAAATTTTSSSSAVFIATDDFEDNNISEYSGQTTLFGTGTTFNYDGTYGLDNVGHILSRANLGGIYRLDQTVSQGETFRYLQYVDTSASSDETCTKFAIQGTSVPNNNYAVCIELPGVDRISLVQDAVENEASASVLLASSTVSFTTGWYEIEVAWGTDNSFNVTLSKDGGAVAATMSATDSSYTSGGIGFTFWFNAGGWDSVSSRPLLATEPTVLFGVEQTNGGASWKAVENTAASYSVNDVARLRFSIENSGLTISNQQFQLEYADMGAAPSCEAVDTGDYVSVPLQASCGTSPICMQSSSFFTNGDSTVDLLTGVSGLFTLGEAREDPSNLTDNLDIAQDEYTELEYSITPTVNISDENMCLRVTNNSAELDAYLKVAHLLLHFDPIIDTATLNDGQLISLLPGTTTRVYATSTVTDLNGYSDIVLASSTIYRSGVTGGATCTANNNDCYISTTANNKCEFTSCAGNSCTVSCYADIFFHADPTDIGSVFDGQEWLAFIEAEDASAGYGFNSAFGVELGTLRAIDTQGTIDYGALTVNTDTGAFNASTSVLNEGNVAINLEITGTDLTDGASSAIPASDQLFATSTFTYSSCGAACSNLSSTTPVAIDVDLGKPTVDSPPVEDAVFWGIFVPIGVNSVAHQGINVFTPISP